ncbi:MAG: hypothetical protein U1F70_06935 [Candidatus Competibacteraceae bacterium]
MQITTDADLPKKTAKIIEETALIVAIHKGLNTKRVKREEVFKLFQDKKSESTLLP